MSIFYEPTLPTQLRDGSTCPSKNCVACAGAALAKIASCGRWKLTAQEIRSEAAVSCYTGTGGLTYEKMAYAVRMLTRGEVTIIVKYRQTRVAVRDFLLAGFAMAESIAYRILLGTRYASEDDFRGGHGTTLSKFRIIDGDAKIRFGDPLADGRRGYPDGWQWLPADLVYRMGEARSADFGSSGITIALAPDTRGVVRRARLNTELRADPTGNSRDIGEIVKGQNYFVIGQMNGDRWQSDTGGHYATGWWRVKDQRGVIGHTRGEALIPTWAN